MTGPRSPSDARTLATALAEHALAACQTWLPNGRKEGRWWRVGNIAGDPGDSLYLRLAPPGPVGKWTDAATGAHGDLLDVLIHHEGSFARAREAALRFLALPDTTPVASHNPVRRRARATRSSSTARAEQIWRDALPLTPNTAAWTYLARRGIHFRATAPVRLRAHPALPYRYRNTTTTLPALVARLDGDPCAIHRTWIDPDTGGKAHLPEPRLALGPVGGRGVTLWAGTTTIIVAEGIETALSVPDSAPGSTVVAALSAGTLATWCWPDTCRRLVIAVDNDTAGIAAARALLGRAREAGLPAHVILPATGDWNDDLVAHGPIEPHPRLQAAET